LDILEKKMAGDMARGDYTKPIPSKKRIIKIASRTKKRRGPVARSAAAFKGYWMGIQRERYLMSDQMLD
jgi:hypothetical protein